MKKYFIIAIAALVAGTACSKVETVEAPAKQITFEVANYVPQTRNSSLESEGYTVFNTYAWYFPAANANPQAYMSNVQVVKGTAAWAPASDYYWPKNGWINFYSYAGNAVPTVHVSDDSKTITAAYSDKVIGANDNYMIADAALHFNSNVNQISYDKALSDFDYATGNYKYNSTSDGAYTGVPTLFHHQLAKVAVIVKLQTTAAKKSSNTWKVEVLDTDANPSNIIPVNKGTLTLTSVDNATTAFVSSWTNANTTNPTVGWVASTTATDVETISLAKTGLTLEPQALTSTQDSVVVAVRTVMPQLTSGVKFNFSYKITANNGSDYMTEVVTIPSTTLAAAVPSIEKWEMNKIYLYRIIIDPVTEKVTFDPAVVEWVNGGIGTINYPAN